MGVLKEHYVYQVVHGRVIDSQDRAVPDVISVGLAQLSHGNATNPIREFNDQFECLRDRRKLAPVWEDDIDFDVLESTLAEGEFGSINELNMSFGEMSNSERENSPEAVLMESPTLQRVDEDDVALDMDGWDLYGNSDEPSDDEDGSEVDDSKGFDFSS